MICESFLLHLGASGCYKRIQKQCVLKGSSVQIHTDPAPLETKMEYVQLQSLPELRVDSRGTGLFNKTCIKRKTRVEGMVKCLLSMSNTLV